MLVLLNFKCKLLLLVQTKCGAVRAHRDQNGSFVQSKFKTYLLSSQIMNTNTQSNRLQIPEKAMFRGNVI